MTFAYDPQERREPPRPQVEADEAADAEQQAKPARAPGDVEQPVGIDQRRHRRERDGDRDEGLRYVELVVVEVEPFIFLLELPSALATRLASSAPGIS